MQLHACRWQGTTPDMSTLYLSALDSPLQGNIGPCQLGCVICHASKEPECCFCELGHRDPVMQHAACSKTADVLVAHSLQDNRTQLLLVVMTFSGYVEVCSVSLLAGDIFGSVQAFLEPLPEVALPEVAGLLL